MIKYKFAFLIVATVTLIANNLVAQELPNFNSNFENYKHKTQVINSQNKVIAEFKTVIANTPQKQQYGLMNLAKLPLDHAMLFVFLDEKIVTMWMKNTLINLDMIFIDKNNKIINIAHNQQNHSLSIISSQKKVDKVLEINANLAKQLEIKVGDQVIWQ